MLKFNPVTFLLKFALGLIGKIGNMLILIRYGAMKKKLEHLKHKEKLREQADEIRHDVDRTPVVDLRNWLRKRAKK